MDARDLRLLAEVLGHKIQFQVPIYQRRYEWGIKQCKQLWDDVLRIGKDKDTKSYFLGSIVCMGIDSGPQTLGMQKYLLIDGQQRLATLFLLIAALGKAIEDGSVEIGITREKLKNDYLFNANETDEYRYKQLLTEHDKETLIRLLEGRETPDNQSLKLLNNYQFFEENLQPDNLNAVHEGLHKLRIIYISLDEGTDQPQLIFESINSTGEPLKPADLIRNYILMGQTSDLQNRLYEEYWRPMERRFGEDYADPLCDFIRYYIMFKTQEYVTKDDVYEKFKRQGSDKRDGVIEDSIKEIYRYSEYYVRFALLKEDDQELRERFRIFDAFQVKIVFPLLLSLYEDYMKERLPKTEFIEVLQLIENYVVRRVICVRSGTKHAIKVFLPLISKINKSNHIENLKKAFAEETGQARYYSDAEFKERFRDVEVYSQRGCNYLLYRLENYEHPKEPISLKDWSKERIMPESMTEEWEEELDKNWKEVHQKYLNTIGNLTLTKSNSELSNRPFKEKKDIFRKSLLSLNQDIIQVERWHEKAIINRANNLSEKALKIWPDHGVSRVMQHEQKEDRTEADYPQLTGEMMELLQELKNDIQNLDASISQSFTQRYIAFKLNNNNFVIIEPQAKGLRLSLKIPYSELFDPARLAADTSHRKKSGLSFGSEVFLSSADHISYVMDLVIQAFEKQKAEKS